MYMCRTFRETILPRGEDKWTALRQKPRKSGSGRCLEVGDVGVEIQFIIHSCMDSRKLVLLFQFSEGETSLELLGKFPNITVSRDRIQSKVFSPWDVVP